MGLGNNVFTELKKEIISFDKKEAGIVEDENLSRINDAVNQLYNEKKNLEVNFSETQLAHMLSINDHLRVKLLKEGKIDEAEKKAEENYESDNKLKKTEKSDCDSEMCIIFPCDEASEWDGFFICHNKCRIHLRCEGKILEDNAFPDNYVCRKCTTGLGNKTWLENTIIEQKFFLEAKADSLKKKHNDVSMDIERLEEEESLVGPRERKLKDSCKPCKIPWWGLGGESSTDHARLC